jgi:hypothetical protein
LWGIDHFYFQLREEARQATATAQALAGSQALQQTATAEAIAGSEELARTATAQAESANATATVQEEAVNATATAQAEVANATATAQAIERERTRCRDQASYDLAISSEPTLWPDETHTWVTDKSPPGMVATWKVTNTGSCAWETVALKPISGGEAERVEVKRDGEPVALTAQGYLSPSVAPGQTVEIELRSRSFDPWRARKVEGEWILVVNDLSLFDLPHFGLEVNDWVIAVTPTPTPIPTPTPSSSPKPPRKDSDDPPNPRR